MREGPAVHVLTQQVDQDRVLGGEAGEEAGTNDLGLDTRLQRAQDAFGGKEDKETKPLTGQLNTGVVGQDDF